MSGRIDRARNYLETVSVGNVGNLCLPAKAAMLRGTLCLRELKVRGNKQRIDEVRSALRDVSDEKFEAVLLIFDEDVATDQKIRIKSMLSLVATDIARCAFESKNKGNAHRLNFEKWREAMNNKLTEPKERNEGNRRDLVTYFSQKAILSTAHSHHYSEDHPRFFPEIAIACIRQEVITAILMNQAKMARHVVNEACTRFGERYQTSTFYLEEN